MKINAIITATEPIIIIAPLTKVGDKVIGSGVRGTLTAGLMHAHLAMVRKETKQDKNS